MIKLFTEEQFNEAKYKDLLPLRCVECDSVFNRAKKEIIKALNPKRKETCSFCCLACTNGYPKIKNTISCDNCGEIFYKKKCEIRKTKHNFCSQSCSAIYRNTHKTHGTRCSKFEKWLSVKLTEKFPSIEFHFNRKDAIVSELDIYIPSLKLAFELNGIFHYSPIFGADKFKAIQDNDDRKIQTCLREGIDLCIIDTSKQVSFNENTCMPFLSVICDIIHKKI